MTSGIMLTGNGIPLARLLVAREMIEQEAKGKKFKGGSVTTKWMRELDVKGSRADLLSVLNAVIKQHQAALRPGEI